MANKDELIALVDAASRGDVEAASKIAHGYWDGSLGKRSYERALKWGKYAAKKGDDKAKKLVEKIEGILEGQNK